MTVIAVDEAAGLALCSDESGMRLPVASALIDRWRPLARPDDMAMAFGAEENGSDAANALLRARGRGCLTVAFCACGAEWEFDPRAVIASSVRS